MGLKELLVWLTTAAGAGAVGYWLIETVPFLRALAAEPKRVVAYLLCAVVAIVGYVLQVAFGYQTAPATWFAWIEILFSIASGAFGLSQLLHGRLKLAKE